MLGRSSGFLTRSISIISLTNFVTVGDRGAGGLVVIEFNMSFKLWGGDSMKGCLN